MRAPATMLVHRFEDHLLIVACQRVFTDSLHALCSGLVQRCMPASRPALLGERICRNLDRCSQSAVEDAMAYLAHIHSHLRGR
jgi:hypothetical protein